MASSSRLNKGLQNDEANFAIWVQDVDFYCHYIWFLDIASVEHLTGYFIPSSVAVKCNTSASEIEVSAWIRV